MTTTTTSGAADLPEALRSIQRFEVVDCIDDKHVPAVIPKPHGPWVRYADHVNALAAGQATAAQTVVPAGWKLVPVDATDEMVRATDEVNFENGDTDGTLHNVWNVMLAAAPTQPATQQPHRSGCTAGTDEECVQRGCGTNCPAVSPRQGVAYADAHGAIMGAAYDFRDAHISGGPNQKRSAHAALESAATHTLRASHGQAPASVLHLVNSAFAEIAMAFPKAFALHKVGIADKAVLEALAAPAGAYTDSMPHLKVGDSSFESWYAGYVKEGTKGLKQHCRDAYAAGMGDPLVGATPTPQTDSVQEDAARWNAWASGIVEACNSDEQEPAFLVALDKAIGDAEPPITLELLNEWTDAACKQGANHDR